MRDQSGYDLRELGGRLTRTHRNNRTRPTEQGPQALIDLEIQRAEKRCDIEEQHGPVKIIMKDGKPV